MYTKISKHIRTDARTQAHAHTRERATTRRLVRTRNRNRNSGGLCSQTFRLSTISNCRENFLPCTSRKPACASRPMPMHAPVVLTGAELGSTTDGMWRTGVLYGTRRYSTVLDGTLRYSTVLYGTPRYSTVLYGTLRYNRALANLVLPQ